MVEVCKCEGRILYLCQDFCSDPRIMHEVSRLLNLLLVWPTIILDLLNFRGIFTAQTLLSKVHLFCVSSSPKVLHTEILNITYSCNIGKLGYVGNHKYDDMDYTNRWDILFMKLQILFFCIPTPRVYTVYEHGGDTLAYSVGGLNSKSDSPQYFSLSKTFNLTIFFIFFDVSS